MPSSLLSSNRLRLRLRLAMLAALTLSGSRVLPALQGPSSSSTRKLSASVDVNGNQAWTDTGLDVKAGDQLVIQAEAGASTDNLTQCDPEGAPRGWRDLLLSLPVNAAGRGALIAQIGNDNAVVPFKVGNKLEEKMEQSGRLYLGLNEPAGLQSPCVMHAQVKIQAGSAAPSSSSSTATSALPRLTSDFFQQVPRRVSDPDNRPGDMVNFFILGPEAGVQQLFQSAGWTSVDRTKKDAAIHMILATLSKDAYTALPMSELYLFGRAQDYGFARAEPLEVVATRHHLRIWKAPFTDGNREVWVGAATHDIGFEKDQRNGGVTHKIDPAVDGERDYVAQSLGGTGLVADSYYVTPTDPVQDAKTATGGEFHSDGRVLILVLK